MSNGSETEAAGIAAQHAPRRAIRIFAAPTDEERFNAIRPGLTPVACWRLDDARFEFDSSFVLPAARLEFSRLAELREDNPGCPISLFGHADPIGKDEYNKKLSGRRARAIHGVLLRDVNEWEELFKEPLGDDDWKSKRTLAMMMSAVPRDDGTPFLESIPGGGQIPTAVVKQFQSAKGLKDDGDLGTNTRKALILAYMSFLCSDGLPAGTPPPAGAEPKTLAPFNDGDFLARGAGQDGKGDVQGCGEFNPILIFSEKEQQDFKKPARFPERNAENAPNRRVVIFFYPAGTQVDPASWPCPTSKEGPESCRKRFWSDSVQRLRAGEGENRRRYEETHDTFACRFYDRFARQSPCEAGRSAAQKLVHISVVMHLDSSSGPLASEKYRLFLPDGPLDAETDEEGFLHHPDIVAGDYKIEIAGKTAFVSAMPLEVNRIAWLVDENEARPSAEPETTA